MFKKYMYKLRWKNIGKCSTYIIELIEFFSWRFDLFWVSIMIYCSVVVFFILVLAAVRLIIADRLLVQDLLQDSIDLELLLRLIYCALERGVWV